MPRRNRTIYDKDATLVIENNEKGTNDVAPMSDTMNVFRNEATSMEMTSVSVSDVLETMAGYVMPDFRFVGSGEKGTCFICGKQTSMSARKLCGDCMKQSGSRLYQLAKQAIENGEKEVKI